MDEICIVASYFVFFASFYFELTQIHVNLTSEWFVTQALPKIAKDEHMQPLLINENEEI